ncbi:uncharacterized protein TNCV_2403171 [Trichonephila clavipes]|uniref:Uncharacterized protein n=1 Tax=Trichonephila clavipes TaxID=2585209 RepID=A0A8X6R0D3_TRICX|nr:uncharacterized protein TNCV_2403171 [Trichonephila clavipes]
MCSIYDVSRIYNHWPLRIFDHLLNTVGINALILHHSVFPEKEIRRSRLLEEIGMDLVQPQWDMRSEFPNLNKKLKRGFTDTENNNPPKKGHYTVCPRVNEVKTSCFCLQRNKNMCLKHITTVCSECLKNE